MLQKLDGLVKESGFRLQANRNLKMPNKYDGREKREKWGAVMEDASFHECAGKLKVVGNRQNGAGADQSRSFGRALKTIDRRHGGRFFFVANTRIRPDRS
jgi:hypothetical protein